MRLTLSSIAVFFIAFQSWYGSGQVSADGVVSRMERVAELMLSNPERCGKHGTTESEIIPVVICGDKLCQLPDSICQYNFVADRFACLNLTNDCKELIAEKMKKSKSRWAKKGANKERRNRIIEDVLRARSKHGKEEDENKAQSEKVSSHRKSTPAAIRARASKIRTLSVQASANKNARKLLRSKALGAKTVSQEPIKIDDDNLPIVQAKEDTREERNNAPKSVNKSPRAHSNGGTRKTNSSRRPKAYGAKVRANSGIAIPLPSDHKGGPPRAKSMNEIHIGNTEELRARSHSAAQPMDDLLKAIEEQSTTPTSSIETPVPEPEPTTEVTFIHLPKRPKVIQRTRSTDVPAITRRLSLRTTTAASEKAEEKEGAAKENAGESDRLEKVIQRHRLSKKNDRPLFGERLLAIRPSLDARQTSDVKQISESVDEDSKHQSTDAEKQPSAEPEPTKAPAVLTSAEHIVEQKPSAEPAPVESSTAKSESDSSHEQPAAEPEPSNAAGEESATDASKVHQVHSHESHSHESVPKPPNKTSDYIYEDSEELVPTELEKGKETNPQVTSTQKPTEKPEGEYITELEGGDDEEEGEHLSAEEPEKEGSDLVEETVSGEKVEDSSEHVSTEKNSEGDISAEQSSGDSEDDENHQAMDWHKSCCEWASEGQCKNNRAFMLPMCQRSCGSYKCMWDNLDECEFKVNLSHCLSTSPVIARTVDERTSGTIQRRRLRTRVHSSGRTVVLDDRIPITLQSGRGHRGIRVALRKVVDN